MSFLVILLAYYLADFLAEMVEKKVKEQPYKCVL